jgi:aliphatic nitrilase
MLICGENTNPLARYALMAQGEQVHVSSYPPIWPTRPPSEDGAYDLKRAIEIRAGAHAFEAKVFNIVASGFVDAAMREAIGSVNRASLEIIDNSPRGISLVLDPTSEVVSDVLSDHEGIIYADIDTQRCVEPKQFHDVVGYYNRFDVFHLEVDRSPREPAHFSQDALDIDAAPLGHAADAADDALFARVNGAL